MHARIPLALLLVAAGGCASTPDAAPPLPLAEEVVEAAPAPAPAPPDPRALRLALRDADPAVRLQAAHEVGLLSLQGEGARVIAEGADEYAPAVAVRADDHAAIAAAADEHEALASTLAGAFATETEPAVRRALVWAMGRRGGPVDVLRRAATDEDDAIRAEALYALAFAVSEERGEATALATGAAGSADPEVRAAAAFLLAALADPATEELAAALTRDGDEQVRAFATRALGRVTTQPSLLEALLGDPSAPVRVEAVLGLLDGARRAGSAGVRKRADLRMEESFARALDRSAEALALQLHAGAGGRALQPLLALGEGKLPPVAAAAVREALAAPAVAMRAARFRGAADADVILHTGSGPVHLVLDDGAAADRFRALVRAGALDGRAIRPVRHGLELDLDGIAGGAPATWRRGSLGFGPDGSLLVGFARTPELDGLATSFGSVAAGIDRLENLRPGERIERAVLR